MALMEQLLLQARDVIVTYPTVMATLGVAVALVAALVTRLWDQSSLNEAEERQQRGGGGYRGGGGGGGGDWGGGGGGDRGGGRGRGGRGRGGGGDRY